VKTRSGILHQPSAPYSYQTREGPCHACLHNSSGTMEDMDVFSELQGHMVTQECAVVVLSLRPVWCTTGANRAVKLTTPSTGLIHRPDDVLGC
jgi:hypothetical protein